MIRVAKPRVASVSPASLSTRSSGPQPAPQPRVQHIP